jgi:hypothetical protein
MRLISRDGACRFVARAANIDADGDNGRSRAALCLVLLARGIGTAKPLDAWMPNMQRITWNGIAEKRRTEAPRYYPRLSVRPI